MSRGGKGKSKGVQKRQRQEHVRQDPDARAFFAHVRQLEAKCEEQDAKDKKWAADYAAVVHERDQYKKENDELKFQAKARETHIELADEKARDAEAFTRSLCDQGLDVDASEIISEEEFKLRLSEEEVNDLTKDIARLNTKLAAANDKMDELYVVPLVFRTKPKA